MTGTRRSSPPPDIDGVRIEKLSSVRSGVWLTIALLLAAGIALLLLSRRGGESPGERSPDPRRVAAAGDNAPRATRSAPAAVEPRRAPIVPPAPAEKPAAPEGNAAELPAAEAGMFDGAKTSGEPSGIALFPPPGTDPVKRGLVVPDGFELPPGYVRHYQTTDDGEQLPPILMFHPDYHPVDEHGDAIALPADRVVPPDMAPSGMPQQMLEVPDEGGAPDSAP